MITFAIFVLIELKAPAWVIALSVIGILFEFGGD